MAYATIDDVRAEGVTEQMANDAKVLLAIAIACQLIDAATGQWFEPRAGDYLLDGSGTHELYLNIPIIQVTELYINWSETLADETWYIVRNNLGAGWPDDRRNPRIQLKNRAGVFARGNANQRIVGRFGFVEADLSTPLLIKRAAVRLAAIYATKQADGGNNGKGQEQLAGPITAEMTDAHSIMYGNGQIVNGFPVLGGLLTTDPEIQATIRLYYRPMSVGSP